MSDGPHRSLGMRRGWKRLSERADNSSFSPEEVRECLPRALAEDCRAENLQDLCRRVRTILTNPQISFFSDQKIGQLEALKSDPAVHPLGGVFLESVILESARGRTGEDAINNAIQGSLRDRATRGVRQVEEHYLRKSTSNKARNVRGRLEAAVAGSDFATIAAGIVGTYKSDRLGTPATRDGLDDGVQF